MTKNRKKLFIAIYAALFVAIALFLLYILNDRRSRYDLAPVISCTSDKLYISVNASEEELLRGVVATDAEDGDITDSITIESISQFTERGTRRITYTAFDSYNHVATASRTLIYIDYEPTRFELVAPLEFNYTSASINPLSCIRAYDCIDGDISDRISVTPLDSNDVMSSMGSHAVQFKVVNSCGDTATLDVDIIIDDKTYTEERYIPAIELSEYLVYLEPGQLLDAKSYVKSVTVLGSTHDIDEYGMENITIDDSKLNISEPGLYSVVFTTERESYIGSATLLVEVRGRG